MKKTIGIAVYSASALLWLIGIAASPAGAAPKADAEMERAQADMARSYERYFQGVRSGAVDSRSSAQQSSFQSEVFGVAQSKLARLVSSRAEQADRILFGKIYSSDGRISDIPTGGFNESSSGRIGSAPGPGDRTPAAEGNPGGSSSSGSIGGAGDSKNLHGRKRMEYTLDGKGVPKELNYGAGGKAPISGKP